MDENADPLEPAWVDPTLLAAVRALSPWERILHNDRMLRTIRLLRPETNRYVRQPHQGF